MARAPRILAVNGGGVGNLHGLRVRSLVEGLAADVHVVDLIRGSYRKSIAHMSSLLRDEWDLIYLESTGLSGGLPLIGARGKIRYIVSSGDPVAGFFHATQGPLMGSLFGVYERALYRNSQAFVGWTPYLAGRALELGAPRAITIEGAVNTRVFHPYPPERRADVRVRFGLPQDHLVCGVVGSLNWVPRHQYSYGLELIHILQKLRRSDVSLLIVGDGSGRSELERRLPEGLRSRVVFTGRLTETEVVDAMNAMDIGFITQTLDQLGSYRLTTKLPEYLACGLPVAMSPIPGCYDYLADAGWALPAAHPASDEFASGCAAWLDALTATERERVASKARPLAESRFDYDLIRPRFQRFVLELLDS